MAGQGSMPSMRTADLRPLVLVVEDDPANRALLERLLEREGYRTKAVGDGEAALLAVAEHAPDLVLLDIGLPHLDGYEVTRRLRANLRTVAVPIILLTGRSTLNDVVEGLDAGADDFLSKPFRQPELLARIRSALRLRQALVRMDAAHNAVAALANAVEAKDPTTERHCQRLANLAARLGAQAGLDGVDLEAVAYGALLHDVGKIGVPDDILLKRGALTASERAVVEEHAALGAHIVAGVLEDDQAEWIGGHHERPDGRGYPERLRASDIPEGASLLALADAWDVMTGSSWYAPRRSVAEALDEVRGVTGAQFSPDAVAALDELNDRGELTLAAARLRVA